MEGCVNGKKKKKKNCVLASRIFHVSLQVAPPPLPAPPSPFRELFSLVLQQASVRVIPSPFTQLRFDCQIPAANLCYSPSSLGDATNHPGQLGIMKTQPASGTRNKPNHPVSLPSTLESEEASPALQPVPCPGWEVPCRNCPMVI